MRDDNGSARKKSECDEGGRSDGRQTGPSVQEVGQSEMAGVCEKRGHETGTLGGKNTERVKEVEPEKYSELIPHTLYRFYSPDGVLQYVGVTKNLQQRSQGHRSSSSWFSNDLGVIAEVYPSRYLAEEQETIAIILETPIHNKVMSDWLKHRKSNEEVTDFMICKARRYAEFMIDRALPEAEVTVTVSGTVRKGLIAYLDRLKFNYSVEEVVQSQSQHASNEQPQ